MNKNQGGFSLIEVLVGIVALSVVGFAASGVLVNTTRDINKTQVIGTIKQNGQNVLTNMADIIRSSSELTCMTDAGGHVNTVNATNLVVKNNGVYLRFRIIPPLPAGSPTSNGFIVEDAPDVNAVGVAYAAGNHDIIGSPGYPSSTNRVCNANPLTGVAATDGIIENTATRQVLTDPDTNNGVSVVNVAVDPGSFFQVSGEYQSADPAHRPVVSVNFVLTPGITAAAGVDNQVDAAGIPFQTSVQLR